MADYITFAELQAEVGQAIKDLNTAKATLIKAIINQVYLNEVPFFDSLYPPFWLLDFDDSLGSKANMTITGASKATAGVITVAHSLIVGDIISVYGITGMTELNNRTYQVGTIPSAGASITLKDLDGTAINTTNYTTYVSGGSIVHRGLTLATTGKDVQTLNKAGFWGYDPMNPIGIDELEKDAINKWTDSPGRPLRYFHRKAFTSTGTEINQLLWFPGADGAHDLKYWYIKRLNKLSDNGDVPLLPPQFHETIVTGAIARLAETNVQVENQVVWPSLYQMQQQAIVEFNRRWWESHKNTEKQKPYLL